MKRLVAVCAVLIATVSAQVSAGELSLSEPMVRRQYETQPAYDSKGKQIGTFHMWLEVPKVLADFRPDAVEDEPSGGCPPSGDYYPSAIVELRGVYGELGWQNRLDTHFQLYNDPVTGCSVRVMTGSQAIRYLLTFARSGWALVSGSTRPMQHTAYRAGVEGNGHMQFDVVIPWKNCYPQMLVEMYGSGYIYRSGSTGC